MVHCIRGGGGTEAKEYSSVACTGSGGGGGGGGGGGSSYTTAALVVQGIDLHTGEMIYNQTVTAVVGRSETVAAPAISGYELDESTASSQTITITSGENKIVFNYNYTGEGEEGLETEKHIPYINGYEDGSVRPDNAISRAEAAAIFFRLLKDEGQNTAINGVFHDVEANAWYAQSINNLASLGILEGYEDGSFQPEQTITRAEFAAVASRFEQLSQADGIVFEDVPEDHWAVMYISNVYAKGWVSGYPDGSFRPENSITRAEVVKIVNAMLERRVELQDIPENVSNYTDIDASHWAYCDIVEASIEHEYTRKDNGSEIWID